jgi:hypothetical protein
MMKESTLKEKYPFVDVKITSVDIIPFSNKKTVVYGFNKISINNMCTFLIHSGLVNLLPKSTNPYSPNVRIWYSLHKESTAKWTDDECLIEHFELLS